MAEQKIFVGIYGDMELIEYKNEKSILIPIENGPRNEPCSLRLDYSCKQERSKGYEPSVFDYTQKTFLEIIKSYCFYSNVSCWDFINRNNFIDSIFVQIEENIISLKDYLNGNYNTNAYHDEGIIISTEEAEQIRIIKDFGYEDPIKKIR